MFKPINTKIKKARVELAQKEQKLIVTKNKAQNLERLKRAYEFVVKRVKQAERKLPKDKEIPQLIRDITNVGKKYNIEINNLTPQPMRSKAYYQEYPFGISVSTRYNQLAFFISDIGQFERIFKIENLNLTSRPPSTPEEAPGVNATFTIVAYTAKD